MFLFMSITAGIISALLYRLLFVLQKKMISTTEHRHRSPSKQMVLAMGITYARLCAIGLFWYGLLLSTQLHFILVLVTFFLVFWVLTLISQ